MRNPFYHAFVPGFNFWYIVVIVGFIVIALVGWHKYYIYATFRGKTLERRYNNRFIDFIAGVFAVVVAIMAIIESGHGIVQFFDNGLAPGESPAWNVLIMPFILMGAAGLYWMILSHVGRFMAKKKKASLKRYL